MSVKGFLERKKIWWLAALLLLIVLKIFSLDPERVEVFYSSQFYRFFSKILRFLFGWIPFSVGDIFYFVAACWLLWKLIKNGILLFRKKLKGKVFLKKLTQFLLGLIFVYLVFNIFWGLNYNRRGIAAQLSLPETTFDTTDVLVLQHLLLQKLNASKQTLLNTSAYYPSTKELFKRAIETYHESEKVYPFLEYPIPSLKSSFYSSAGNYLGFTGYYNPFSGEAQVNTKVPKFLQPYIATHEIGHQIGYAKENEASFAGYLAAVNSGDTLFHYSAYLDLFIYANREVFYFDSAGAKLTLDSLIPQVKNDIEEWKNFSLAHRSFIEPAITWMYGNFLKMNEQPKGMRSYNEVIFMLLKYYKKFGKI